MLLYTLILYSCFMLYLGFGIYVLKLNTRSLSNRYFFILCLCLSLWALGFGFMSTAGSAESALFWHTVSAAGWCFFNVCFLIFTLVLFNQNKFFEKLPIRLALYLPSLIFFIYYASLPLEGLLQTDSGWVYLYGDQPMDKLFDIYQLGLIMLGLLILFLWGKKTEILREKRQARIVFITTAITAVLVMIPDLALPYYLPETFPAGVIFCAIGIWGMGYAITKYKLMKVTLETEADYILKTMSDPVIYYGRDLLIKEVNQAMLDVTGYSPKELIGRQIKVLFRVEEEESLLLDYLLNNDSNQNIEKAIFSKNNREIPCLLSGSGVKDDLGEVLGTVCIFHDITERKNSEILLQKANDDLEARVQARTSELEEINQRLQIEIMEREKAQERIQYIAYHDALTGLPNRLLFNERVSYAIPLMQRNGKQLAVLFLDLDNFKIINDSLGHQKGDDLLCQVAARLKAITRQSDTIARIGGDEFCILITNLQEVDNLEIVLNKIIGVFHQPFLLDHYENYVSVSMGVALYPTDGENAESLTRNADIAMYEAKSSGKNTYRLCSQEMKRLFVERSKLRNHLYKSMENEELSVFYQPQISLRDHQIVGLEALMRWKLLKEKYISPSEFIPMAEETGFIIPMGEWLIRRVCQDIRRRRELGLKDIKVAVNVSENQLKQRGFPQIVKSILQEYDLEAEMLEFEITERIVFKGNEDTLDVLEEIKKLGISISIDDFGIEYSSFMNIKKLPIDRIKIAMQFIQGINDNHKDAAIVDSIISLSHKLGLGIVAEGVETSEQLEYLKTRVCDEVQGYYFYKPMPEDQIEGLLKQKG